MFGSVKNNKTVHTVHSITQNVSIFILTRSYLIYTEQFESVHCVANIRVYFDRGFRHISCYQEHKQHDRPRPLHYVQPVKLSTIVQHQQERYDSVDHLMNFDDNSVNRVDNFFEDALGRGYVLCLREGKSGTDGLAANSQLD